jgi:quercetin dioxygenase-like cupin family protein
MKDTFPALIRNLPAFEGPFHAFKLAADSCSLLFASYPAGTTIEPHTHDTDNVGVITKGALVLTINGETTQYAVGDWYHVPAQTEHSARFDQETEEIEFWFET